MANITIETLTKRFDDVVAVDDVNVDIEDGEFIVLVGPSGCGKTTTLRMIAGLETPSEGQIQFDGDLMNYRTPQNRDVAMVFQDYALYPHMTVRGNMKFGLEEEPDFTDEERKQRVEEVAELLDISELLDRRPEELSGGQQQRVALGRAIVRDPEVFLMDEPLSNLDAKLRAQMRTELQQLQEQLDVTTVYVTHDQTEAMTMSDRMVVMNDGVLQQVGEPLELYHEPTNMFVAQFIGEPSMNFLDGSYEDEAFVSEQLAYPFDDRITDGLSAVSDNDRLVLGIRPEDIELHDPDGEPQGETSHENHTAAMSVTVVEPMGNENVIHLTFPDSSSGTEDLIAIADGMRRIDADSDIHVHIPPEAVHVFDAETGDALYNRRLEHEGNVIQI
ncbi:ABC transporter ATP-binding protein [Halocatena pleomorpha]|uniref:ABC-type D-xylose/L-arabinose transporter n=1 Tax=Halocatena pleomorpha TaxID=1785090 RepID=A0A3P3RK23_9EURY|nr:ABC transporter ATP-binding protein [Halocatena pleomorpha]RRJ33684.1 ABC transporter ATP-binding protein [Halocatena pleomorpha]